MRLEALEGESGTPGLTIEEANALVRFRIRRGERCVPGADAASEVGGRRSRVGGRRTEVTRRRRQTPRTGYFVLCTVYSAPRWRKRWSSGFSRP